MSTASQNKLFSAERRLVQRGGGLPFDGLAPAQAELRSAEILNAIEDVRNLIKEMMSPSDESSMPELSILRGQLHELRDSIEKTKREIAAVRRPDATDDRLMSAALELDAIVAATEEATHNILSAAEDIEDRVAKLKERVGDVTAHELLDEITGLSTKIFENCNFQDITGQRTSKVIRTINYLEERITTMIEIWGAEEFVGVKVEEDATDADKQLLQGPQLEGQGISQSDIDALFD